MLPSAVIFDMDGLMFDTERLGKRAWQQIGQELGLDIDEPVLQQIRGANRATSARIFREAYGPSFDYPTAKARRNKLVEEWAQANGVPVKPGLRSLLQILLREGIRTAVASSSPMETICRYLDRTDLRDSFSVLLSGEGLLRSKPAPDLFLAAAEQLGCPPGRCLVLEDSANGVLAAKAGGIPVICIPDLSPPSEEVLNGTLAVLPSLKGVWPFLQADAHPDR